MSDFITNQKRSKHSELLVALFFLFLVAPVFVIILLFVKETSWVLLSAGLLLLVPIFAFLHSIKDNQGHSIEALGSNKLNEIISSISDALIVYDFDFQVVFFNKAAEEIFGVSKSRVMGKTITSASINDRDTKVLAQVIFPSLAPSVLRRTPPDSYPQIVDISFEDPSLELRVTTNRLLDDDGRVFGFLKIVRDRTREVEIIKTKNDFITVAAHQLRTPLTAVGWVMEELDKEKLDENQKTLVQTGLGASNNLLQIVEDLLNAAKLEEGKFEYDFQNIDLIEFLNLVLAEAQPVARQYKVSIFLEPPKEASLKIFADPKKLGVIFSNLLNNAIKYNIPNGRVVVNVERVPNKPYVKISIADTGIGIPEEDVRNLFSKFFRGSNAVTKETTGSGLGLYMTKNIVQRHGGQIWVDSVLGRGSIFNFTLPTDSRLVPVKEIVYGDD